MNMKKILLLIFLIVLNTFSFEYDYYHKVHILEINKNDLFHILDVTDRQRSALTDLFLKMDAKAVELEKKLLSFEEKKEKLGIIEWERYDKISNILSETQLKLFNEYILEKKMEFEERKDKIKILYEKLKLTNEQKYKILKLEKSFKRNIKKIKTKGRNTGEIILDFMKLNEEKISEIEKILDENQREILKLFNI